MPVYSVTMQYLLQFYYWHRSGNRLLSGPCRGWATGWRSDWRTGMQCTAWLTTGATRLGLSSEATDERVVGSACLASMGEVTCVSWTILPPVKGEARARGAPRSTLDLKGRGPRLSVHHWRLRRLKPEFPIDWVPVPTPWYPQRPKSFIIGSPVTPLFSQATNHLDVLQHLGGIMHIHGWQQIHWHVHLEGLRPRLKLYYRTMFRLCRGYADRRGRYTSNNWQSIFIVLS